MGIVRGTEVPCSEDAHEALRNALLDVGRQDIATHAKPHNLCRSGGTLGLFISLKLKLHSWAMRSDVPGAHVGSF